MKNKLIGMEKEKRALELAIKADLPTLIIGETGAGKTYLVRAIAQEQNKTLTRINLNGETGISELIGKWTLKEGTTVWQDGILLHAVRNGHYIVLDEINAALPEVLFVLNSLLDDDRQMIVAERDNEAVKVNPECRFFATMNPCDEYSGTKELNRALLSRFGVVIHVSYQTANAEKEILQYHAPEIDDEEAKTFIDVANLIRRTKIEGEISYTCSTRDIVQGATIFSIDGLTIQESIIYSIINKAPKEDREKIKKLIEKELSIELPENCTRGRIKVLLKDYRKSIEELEGERNTLTEKINSIEDRLKKALDLEKEETTSRGK